jgi:hypothetical protein
LETVSLLSPEIAATPATTATHDRGNVAAVADVATPANGTKPIADEPSAVAIVETPEKTLAGRAATAFAC